ncbi:MAG: 4Fe-4S binding protein [Deltaproteobacteria bacterium]|nr:4Fe-4S binding protein [Deltaproteobacteria bacterium]
MKELCVLSGKGGTGKTSLVGALAALVPNKILVDCDVDAPDLHLLLAPKIQNREAFWGGRKAVIIPELCTACGRCREVCGFEAISEDFQVDPTSCEGCSVCVHFCSFGAIDFPLAQCGEWFVSETRFGDMVHAQLGLGQENSGLLVALIRGKAQEMAEAKGIPLILVDGPPGIGCPVISSLTGADGVLIVTEPTLSGLHDLDRVLDLAGHFHIPGMVLINKYDLNQEMSDQIETYCREKGLGLAGRLPYDPVVTEAMIQGKTIPEMNGSNLGAEISILWEKIQENLLKD